MEPLGKAKLHVATTLGAGGSLGGASKKGFWVVFRGGGLGVRLFRA